MRDVLLFEGLVKGQSLHRSHCVNELEDMIADHFIGFSLVEEISELFQLVGNAHSEFVIRSLPVQRLQEDLYLCPYLIPLHQA